jgi:lipopolysaccharide transport system permease protein
MVTRTVILPPGRVRLELHEMWRLRETCFVLARRLLKVRYRQTVVGAGWALIQPLTMMIVFTAFFSLLGSFPSGGVPYPVFAYAGLMIWLVVAKLLSEGATSVISNSSLITKVYFPRIYLPLAVAIGAVVDLVISFIVLAILLLWFGVIPGWQLVFAPVMLLIALAAGLGATFWLSALNAEYRDVTQLLPFLTQLWFFLTPIFYSPSIIPEQFRVLYWINPLAIAVDGFRWTITGLNPPPIAGLLIGGVIAALLLISGYVFFRFREPAFADVV